MQVNLIHGVVTNRLVSFTASTTTFSEFDIQRITFSEPGEYTLQFHQDGGSKIYVTGFDNIELECVSDLNLIQNGSFDEGSISGNYQFASASDWPENPHWTCGPLEDRSDFGVGLCKAGSGGWVASGVPVGTYAAYLRTNQGCRYAHMEQTFDIAVPGFYKVGFSCMANTQSARQGEPVGVRLIHGGVTNVVCTVTAESTGRKYRSAEVEVPEAGEYTLQFYQGLTTVAEEDITSSTAKATAIDDVEFSRIPDVTVRDGAGLDMASPSDSVTPCYPMILDGGALYRQGTAYLRNMLLTGDSEISVSASGSIGRDNENCLFDLGGKTLTANIASGKFLRIYNCTIKGGTLVSAGAGTLRLGLDTAVATAFTAADLCLVANTAIYPFSEVDLVDYTANYAGNGNQGTATVNVSGVFTPTADGFYANTVLGAGATIDFTGRTASMPLGGLAFEDGTIHLKFGERRPANPVIAWSGVPANMANLTFAVSPDTAKKTLLEIKGDGVYAKSGAGLMVTIK